jgi:anti-sigma factor RsiW
MNHLDDLAAALVDDELRPAERDRALAHVAGCAPCREEVEAQRRLKARLAGVADPQPTEALMSALLAVPSAEPAPADVVRRSARSVGPAAGRPRSRGLRRTRPVPARGRSVVRTTAGVLSAVAVALGGAVLLGGTQGDVKPPVSTFVADHSAANGSSPLSDPAADIVLTSFTR